MSTVTSARLLAFAAIPALAFASACSDQTTAPLLSRSGPPSAARAPSLISIIDLGTFDPGSNPSPVAEATDVNPNGIAVGFGWSGVAGAYHAFVWKNGELIDLHPAGEGGQSVARGISPSGDIVGEAPTEGGTQFHAVIWRGGNIIDLGTLGGDNSEAHAINATGQIVGFRQTAEQTRHAFL